MESYGHPLATLLGSGVSLVIGLAAYLYAAFALMAVAKRTNTPNGWLGFIPIANVYLMTQIARLPWWWTLCVVAAIIPHLGGLIMLAAMVYIWWKIAERLGKPGWWSLLLLVPVVNLAIIGIMAWGS
jgi:hypothetical protein